MSKFKVGDRVRKINNEYLKSFPIGQELFVTGISGLGNYWVGKELGEKKDTAYESDLELIADTPKEITLNGATYVLKEEQKPEHEWKFGDVAVHKDYGVGIVTDTGFRLEFTYKNGSGLKYCNRSNLTFLRRADLSV